MPEWARPPKTSPLLLTEDRYDDFARFAAAFADHFRGRVGLLIVWNEPNLSQEWGYRPPDPGGLHRTAVPNLSGREGRRTPTCRSWAARWRRRWRRAGSEWALNDLDYLQGMYDAGAAACFDLLAAHSYGWTFDPDEPASPDAVNFSRVELLRDVMVRNGDGAKHIIITEGGWNDHPRWTKAVRPPQRAAYTVPGVRQGPGDGRGWTRSASGRSVTRGRRAPIRTTIPSWTATSSPSRSISPCSGMRHGERGGGDAGMGTNR